jgi:hypothetical protein
MTEHGTWLPETSHHLKFYIPNVDKLNYLSMNIIKPSIHRDIKRSRLLRATNLHASEKPQIAFPVPAVIFRQAKNII